MQAQAHVDPALVSLLEAFDIPHLCSTLSTSGISTLSALARTSTQTLSRITATMNDKDKFATHSAIAAAESYLSTHPEQSKPKPTARFRQAHPPYGSTLVQQRRIRGESVPFVAPPFPNESSGLWTTTIHDMKAKVASDWKRFGPSGPLEPYLRRPQSGKRNQRHFTISHCPTLGSTNCERWHNEIRARDHVGNGRAEQSGRGSEVFGVYGSDRAEQDERNRVAEGFADLTLSGVDMRESARLLRGQPALPHRSSTSQSLRKPKPSRWWNYAERNSPILTRPSMRRMQMAPLY